MPLFTIAGVFLLIGIGMVVFASRRPPPNEVAMATVVRVSCHGDDWTALVKCEDRLGVVREFALRTSANSALGKGSAVEVFRPEVGATNVFHASPGYMMPASVFAALSPFLPSWVSEGPTITLLHESRRGALWAARGMVFLALALALTGYAVALN